MSRDFTSDLKMKFDLPAPADAKTDAPLPVAAAPGANDDVTAGATTDDSPTNMLIDLLPDDQRRAIELLVQERSDLRDPNAYARRTRPNVSKIAEQVGVHRGTLYRWLSDDPAFNRALAQWHCLLAKRQRTRVLLLGDKALTVLDRVMDSYKDETALKAAEIAIKAKQRLEKELGTPPDKREDEPADGGTR